MAQHIKGIYSAFKGAPESSYLVIKEKNDHYIFSSSERYDEEVAFITWKKFESIFGQSNVSNICQQASITKLDKRSVRKILVTLAVFQKGESLMHFRTIEEMERLFLDKGPNKEKFRYDKAKNCGKGFSGLCDKVYLQWLHYFSVNTSTEDRNKTKIREAEFLTGRLGDREFQEGAYVYLGNNQIYQVDRVVIKGGAYMSILRNTKNSTEVKIVCRGTRFSPKASGGFQSALDDLHYELGNAGVQACWPSITTYLSDHEIKEVEVLGKSLGGAHAQRLSLLIMSYHPNILKELTTVFSVGVGSEAEAIFETLLATKEHREEEVASSEEEEVSSSEEEEVASSETDAYSPKRLKITVIRNGGDKDGQGVDYIPCVGGEHLGATLNNNEKVKIAIYYIHPSNDTPTQIDDKANFFKKSYHFIKSFHAPHIRQTSLEDFSYTEIKNSEENLNLVKQHLNDGKSLERVRRWISIKAPISFTEFVKNPNLRGRYTTIQKITLTVSSMLFVLTIAGLIACLMCHPGLILYQGGGMTLTLPTMIVSGAGGLSLIFIAMSSIHWAIAARAKEKQLLGVNSI